MKRYHRKSRSFSRLSASGSAPGGLLRKIVPILSVTVAVLSLTGCLDVLQYVGVNEKGETEVSMRLTLQKALFEMAGEMSGEGDEAEDVYNEEFNMEELTREMPDWIQLDYEKINTDQEIGVSMLMTAEPAGRVAAGDVLPPLFPVKQGDEIRIRFPTQIEGEADEVASPEEDQFTAAFFASSKIRFIISKQYAPRIREAFVIFRGAPQEIPVSDLHEVYLVEIPLSFWMMSREDMEVVIR